MNVVKIVSGPRVGQQNLGPMRPEDLYALAEQGWRWAVDWKTVADSEALEWGRIDLMAKVISALVRGGEVRFLDYVWQGGPGKDAMVFAQEIEDVISGAGLNLFAGEDTETYFVIDVHSAERLDG